MGGRKTNTSTIISHISSEHKKLSAFPIQSKPLRSALTSVSSCSNEMNWSLESQRPLSDSISANFQLGRCGNSHCEPLEKNDPKLTASGNTLSLRLGGKIGHWIYCVANSISHNIKKVLRLKWATTQTHKLFNAMQSLSGTMPYQQLPPQLAWSHKRTPPRLRLVRGVAVVIVVVVARKRVARKTLSG